MQDTIKRFITCYVPVTACNFQCTYCYLRNLKDREIHKFCITPEKIAQKLSVENLGGICYFNLCADGETMMHPQLIELISLLTQQGHYVDIITNGTIKNKFEELIASLSELQMKHVMVKFSFHYIQLKEQNLLSKFVDNVNLVKNTAISYSIEITPHDELVKYIDEIKEFSIDNFGALPHITVARNSDTKGIALLTTMNRDDYKRVWGQFDSTMFDFKFSTFNKKRHEFCYAGDWSIKLDLGSGEYKQCYEGIVLGSICDDEPLHFKAIGKCRLPHCYNGHAFLALGTIPELECPTYAQERARKCLDGSYWLKPDIYDFFSTRLFDANRQYNKKERIGSIIDTGVDILKTGIHKVIGKIKVG